MQFLHSMLISQTPYFGAMSPAVTDNTDKKRFELALHGRTAFVDYILTPNGKIYLTHTEVPPELEGQGVGGRLVSSVLQVIDERALDLIPTCPFVISYLRRHPEWKRLLDKNFRS